MGPTWAQEASKPAPGALRDASSTAKDPSRGAKRLPRASRDSPKLDFDPPQGRLGVGFDPPGSSKRLKNCSYAVPQVTATAAAIAFPNCRVGGCSRQRLQLKHNKYETLDFYHSSRSFTTGKSQRSLGASPVASRWLFIPVAPTNW